MNTLMDSLNAEQLKQDLPEFDIGDTVRVSIKIIEGEKERIQVFQGTVIARKGNGLSETFSVHRVSYGEGMERVFYLHSPRVVQIEVVKKGDVRRSKLYYLRGKTGKAAKVKEKLGAITRLKKGGAKPPTRKHEAITETEELVIPSESEIPETETEKSESTTAKE